MKPLLIAALGVLAVSIAGCTGGCQNKRDEAASALEAVYKNTPWVEEGERAQRVEAYRKDGTFTATFIAADDPAWAKFVQLHEAAQAACGK